MASNETFDFRGPAGRLEAILMLPEAPPVGGGGRLPRAPAPRRDDALQGRLPRREGAAVGGARRPALQLPRRGPERRRPRPRHRRAGGRPGGARRDAGPLPGAAARPGRLLLRLGRRPARRRARREGPRRLRPRLSPAPAAGRRGCRPTRILRRSASRASSSRARTTSSAPARRCARSSSSLPPPREIAVIPGADHFFDGQPRRAAGRDRRLGRTLRGGVVPKRREWRRRRCGRARAHGVESREPRVERTFTTEVSTLDSFAAPPPLSLVAAGPR